MVGVEGWRGLGMPCLGVSLRAIPAPLGHLQHSWGCSGILNAVGCSWASLVSLGEDSERPCIADTASASGAEGWTGRVPPDRGVG